MIWSLGNVGATLCGCPGQAHGPAPTGVLTIPKAFGFEAATQSQVDNLQIYV